MTRLYYEPPLNALFDEVKIKAMELWHEVDTYNDAFGYASGKCDRIRDIANIEDNFMYIVAMFDDGNQRKLADKLSTNARLAIRHRMIDGGNPTHLIPF